MYRHPCFSLKPGARLTLTPDDHSLNFRAVPFPSKIGVALGVEAKQSWRSGWARGLQIA